MKYKIVYKANDSSDEVNLNLLKARFEDEGYEIYFQDDNALDMIKIYPMPNEPDGDDAELIRIYASEKAVEKEAGLYMRDHKKFSSERRVKFTDNELEAVYSNGFGVTAMHVGYTHQRDEDWF